MSVENTEVPQLNNCSGKNTTIRRGRFTVRERPYLCVVCSKRFTQKAHLIIHKRIHTGEKPYACHICFKRFAQSSHLAVHKRVHTGEKPFFCKVCGIGFCRKRTLESHLLQHIMEKNKTSGEDSDSECLSDISLTKLNNIPPSNFFIKENEISELEEIKSKEFDNEKVLLNHSYFQSKNSLNDRHNHTRNIIHNKAPTNADMPSDWTIGIESQQYSNSFKISNNEPNTLFDFNKTDCLCKNESRQNVNSNKSISGMISSNNCLSLTDFTTEDIVQHLMSRDDIKSCDFCCVVFHDPAMYYLHRCMHDKMDVRCCNVCGDLLKDKYDFIAHFLSKHK